ncbi:MAG: hypothetical protein JWQ35_1329 [Bacteriovoracaceae bacterium]|nr:hypothetical protein [Bacteriovoracaceae bacterium]
MGRPLRIVLFTYEPYTWCRWWVPSLSRAFESLGHRCEQIEFTNDTPFQEITARLLQQKPDLIVTQNFFLFDPVTANGPALEEFVSKYKIPTVCWYTDHPDSGSFPTRLRWRTPPYPSNFIFIVPDRDHITFFKERGLQTFYVHGAVDEKLENFRADPDAQIKFKSDISFVAGSHPIKHPEMKMSNPKDIPYLYAYSTSNQIQEFVEHPDFLAMAEHILSPLEFQKFLPTYPYIKQNLSFLYDSLVTFNLERLERAKEFKVALQQLYRTISNKFSPAFAKLLELLDHRIKMDYSFVQMIDYANEMTPLGMRVYGNEYWKEILSEGADECRILTPDETLQVYAASKIVFTHQKWQYTTCLHEREFLALSVHSFPLINYRKAADELFNPGDLETWVSIEEAKNKAKYFLAHDSLRIEKVKRARETLFKRHTLRHRAIQVIEIVEKHFGLKKYRPLISQTEALEKDVNG